VDETPDAEHTQTRVGGKAKTGFSLSHAYSTDLLRLLNRIGSLPEELVVRMGLAILRDLTRLHREGKAHGTIGPGAVFVAWTIDRDRTILLSKDWNYLLGRPLSVNLAPIPPDSPAAEGSRPFAPPEAVASAGRVRPLGDIYSVGATLYTALTGKVFPAADERLDGSHAVAATIEQGD
jgi:eukaryotic-like serine/threonine-protein kinase